MRPALFLDRDGVINVDRGYVHCIEDFEWLPGIFDLARAAVDGGLLIVVVTNQSGIGRGYYLPEDFQVVTAYMRARFAAEGAPLAAVYHCPFHPDALWPEHRAADHPLRKPRPGMILAARDELGIDLTSSILIGDRASDIEAGAAAGVGTLVLIGNRCPAPGAVASAMRHFATVADAALWMADETRTTRRG